MQKILSHSVMQEYGPSHLLVQQGDTPEGIYLVIEGTLKTFRLNEDGGEAVIRLLEPGGTCMEAVLFMGGPSPIAAQTLTKCKLMLMPERIVRQHVLDDSQFAVNILRIVTRHYKGAMHQIDAMNIKSPLQRVGYYFLSKHIEAGHDDLEFTLPFKKQIIANYLGMTPETFSRTLKQMQAMGINVSDEKIRMKDAYSLCHFCDSDTAAMCPRHDNGCGTCPLN
ncbi:Crp/Fnr family transcriptional regulator [Micavibrio aeruginosavorus]|uniref:Crp/Fnr family transcriptional regulator n=1 Tax=Micavibrio aeruginosavorus TaxID=349221 RepID=UPI001F3E7568|nr:Crp/Fnr family transcriptional regulator [Micavibrio aeruginosavorus]